MIRPKHVLAITAAVTLAGLTAPAVATEPDRTKPLGASGGVWYGSRTSQVAGDASQASTSQEVTAGCDRNWALVAGGQTIQPRSEQGINHAWTNHGVEWHAGAWQRSDTDSLLASYAVCMRTEELSSVTATSFDVPADSAVSRGIMCGEGSPVSGGFLGNGEPADFALNASYPVDGGDPDATPDDGWVTYVDYTGDGGDNIAFSVRCLENTSLTYRSASIQVAPGASVAAKAVCPKGSPVVGGGLYVEGEAHLSHVVASRPWDSKDPEKVPEDGWRAGVYNTSALELGMTVHAVCRQVTSG